MGGYEGPAWTASEVLIGSEKASGPDHPPGFDVFAPAPFADGDVEPSDPREAVDDQQS
jgi:hypothetical protein